ncbi:cytochrome c [Methylocystis sp. B8]|uniref:SorB family sulfite dehydrogenase c-type cytochrome subunit n=1 Tax=Methylocystis sp. B8 TaxID=544938 RepID=UPI0010FECE85|nr:cytochrome c [Methylocystis sp. B8]TLG75512.1 cytochrome c [Methylocystis sp. B8]
MQRFDKGLMLIAATALLAPTLCAAETLTYSLPEEAATLRAGPGEETALKNCAACHSVDYIERQPPKMGHAFWEGVVKKMTQSYHAQIDESDAQKIIDYLAATY